MATKRTQDFKDPGAEKKKPNTQLWNSINNIPKQKLKMYVRPKVLIRDKEACEHIIMKMQEEEVKEVIKK